MNLPFNRFGDQLFCLKSISKILTFFKVSLLNTTSKKTAITAGKDSKESEVLKMPFVPSCSFI